MAEAEQSSVGQGRMWLDGVGWVRLCRIRYDELGRRRI